MRKTILMVLGMVFLAGVALAGDPTETQRLPIGQPNMMKMKGASPTFNKQVNYGDNFFQAVKDADGKYTIAVRFDPRAVETLVPELNERIRLGQLPYTQVRVWLGNLNDKGQRKNMPEGVVDLDDNVVVFEGVKLSGTERINLPVKFYDAAGKEIKIPNDNGGPLGKGYGWGWIPSGEVSTEASVEGTPHNGWRFEVQPDGTLLPRGIKVQSIP